MATFLLKAAIDNYPLSLGEKSSKSGNLKVFKRIDMQRLMPWHTPCPYNTMKKLLKENHLSVPGLIIAFLLGMLVTFCFYILR